MLKNRIFTILIVLTLMTPVFAEEPVTSDVTPVKKENILETNLDKELEEFAYKQPVSKRKIAKKFLMAMGGVAISSILLFILLSAYNKLRESLQNSSSQNSVNDVSLETPENLEQAIKSFLNKTNW